MTNYNIHKEFINIDYRIIDVTIYRKTIGQSSLIKTIFTNNFLSTSILSHFSIGHLFKNVKPDKA